MYIEFAGVPGAGKTTLVEKVKELLVAEGVECTTRATFFPKYKTWKYKLWWMLLHFRYLDFPVARLLFKLSRLKGSTLLSLVTRLHEHQKLQYQLAHHEGKVVLWDAGHTQRLSNIARLNILSSVTVIDIIYNRLPEESLLIFVDVPVEESVRRLKKREPGRRVDGLLELHAQTKEAQENIFASLAEKGVATMSVDGTESLEDNAMVVCERIKTQI